MRLKELEEVARQKRYLLDLFAGKPGVRNSPTREASRRKLDEILLSVRAARKQLRGAGCRLDRGNWLRMVRQATGTPVELITDELGITKWELFRLEKAERSSRIQLSSLRRVAAALGCEVVYAVVPREGSLEDLAAKQKERVEEAREHAQRMRRVMEPEIDEVLDWQRVLNRAVRGELRKRGIRVR